MMRHGPLGRAYMNGVVRHCGLSGMWFMQAKGSRRGRMLVACLYNENRVLIRDLETGDQKVIEVKRP